MLSTHPEPVVSSPIEVLWAADSTKLPEPGQPKEAPSVFSLEKVKSIVLLAAALTGFAYLARPILVPITMASVAALALNPPLRWMLRLKIPRPLSAALIVGCFGLGAGSIGYYLGRPAVEWVASAPEKLPSIRQKFEHILRPAARLSAAASSVGSLEPSDNAQPPRSTVEVKDNHMATSMFTWTGSMLTAIGETVGLLFLFLAAGDFLAQNVLRVIPTLTDKKKALGILHEIQHQISGYLFAISAINIGFGIAVGFLLSLVGMPNAVMWGGMAAFANFIPYFGPILGICAIAVAGLVEFDTLGSALMPALVYLGVHLIEANLITPFLVGRRCALNPILIFLALIVLSWLWGVAGALLAVPILVTLKVIGERLPPMGWMGVILSHNPD